MAGSLLIRDLFDGMTSGTSINGRVPQTTESGYAWKVETSQGTATSDGAGAVRFSSSGAVCQQRTLAESQVAVQAKWNDGGSLNGLILYLGDRMSSTIYPRTAYGAIFSPRAGTFQFVRYDSFETFGIGSEITGLTYTLTADVFAFERNDTDFQARLNGTVIGTFTDASKLPDGTRRHHGVVPYPYVNNAGKMIEFEIYDSIAVIAAPSAYTIVEIF